MVFEEALAAEPPMVDTYADIQASSDMLCNDYSSTH